MCSLPEQIEYLGNKKNQFFIKTNKNGEIKKAGDPKRAHVPLSLVLWSAQRKHFGGKIQGNPPLDETPV